MQQQMRNGRCANCVVKRPLVQLKRTCSFAQPTALNGRRVRQFTNFVSAGTEVLVDQPQEILVTSPNDIPRGFGGAEERQSGALGSGRSSISPDSGFGSAGSKRSAAAAGGAGVRRAGPVGKGVGSNSTEILLPYKCSACEYRARWPSEITQHMKNHSDEKPFHCPRYV